MLKIDNLRMALRPVCRVLTSNEPRILMYHRFASVTTARAIGIDDFREQLKLLSRRFTVLPVSDVIRELSRGKTPKKPYASITIDDGYEDFYSFAFPILNEFGIRPTLFVVSGFIEGDIWLWPDQIRHILEQSTGEAKELSGFWRGKLAAWESEEERESLWHELADRVVVLSPLDRVEAIRDLSESMDILIKRSAEPSYRAMTWEQIRDLNRNGVEIGDHTWSHMNLAKCSRQELVDEVRASREKLNSELGEYPKGFAYPNGTKTDYNSTVVEEIVELGYEYAVTSQPARYSKNNRFEIGRLGGQSTRQVFLDSLSGIDFVKSRIRRE